MLNEYIELALREADVQLFEIPVGDDVDPKQLERLAGLDIVPEDHERVLREIEAFAREALPRLVVDYRAPDRRNGRVRWRRVRGSLVRDEHGLATRLVGSTQDITPVNEYQQEEARRAVEQFQLATRLSNVTVWNVELVDGDLANAKAVCINLGESLGYGSDEISADLASGLELILLPEDRPGLLARVQAYLDGRSERFEAEYRVRRKDGSVEWQLCRGVAVRDADGRPTRFTGTSVLVTRIKQAEAELRAISEKFDLAARLFDFRVTEVDLRGASTAAEPVIGPSWHRDGCGLRTITLASHIDHIKQDLQPEDVPRALELLDAAIRGDIPEAGMQFRARSRRGDGFRWRVARFKVYCDEGGVPARYITLSNDIQQLKTAEEEAQSVLERAKSAEEEARRAVELLRLATRLSEVTVWSIDLAEPDLASARATFVNMAESLGYRPEEIPADLASILELTIFAEDRPGLMAALQAYLDGRTERFETEGRVIRKDGSLEWHLARGVAIRDADGRPIRLTGTSVLVTRIKQAEAELRATSDKFNLAARLFDFRVTEIDLRGLPLPAQALGIGSGDWNGRGLRSMPLAAYFEYLKRVLLPEDLPPALDLLESAIRGDILEAAIECRVWNPAGDGYRWRLGRVKVYCDENGVAERCIAYSHDIQRLKTAEEDARQAAQQLRLATDLSSVSIWRFELENGDLESAKSVSAVDSPMGYHTRDLPLELVARIEQFVPHEDRARLRGAFEDAISGKAPQVEVECRVIQKDGSFNWHLERGIVTRDAVGRPLSLMGTSVDITQLKHTQAELQRVKDRLELALQVSNAFTWDLETPDGLITAGRAVFINAWESCGYAAPSDPHLAAQVLSVLLPPGEAERFMAGVQAFFDGTGREWEAEQRVLHRDGTERWHLMRGVVERGANGRVTRFTGTSIDISDRKLMERELSDSEERFRRTFENAAVGMILTDIDGNLLEYNRRFCEFLGYSAEELAGRRLFELMDPNEAVLHRETQERIVRGEAPVFTRDSRYFRKDGAVVWGTLTLSVIQHHPDGTPLHVMGILQDITERKALEATLELATRLSRVYSWSFELEDGKINNARATLVNVWESLGYDSPPEAAQFESAMTLVILPEDQPAVWGAVFACLEGRMPQFEAEYRIRHADGSIHWNLGRGIVTRDTSGRPLRFLGTSVDITELKRVQDEARKNKERLELAVLGSRACTWDFDLVDGTIANARAAYTNVWELLGYAEAAPSGSFGDGLASLIHPEEQAQFVARVQSFLDGTQHRFESEVRCRFIDGSDRWQLARGVVDRDARGRVVRFTGSSVDITDRKEMESVVHESEARFRRTFENAAVGMILTDTNGEFLEYNRRFCEFLGYSPDELARRCLLDFMGPDAAALHVECQQRVVRGETPTFTHDTRYLCKDGAVVWGNLTVSIIQRRADGTPLQLMAILQDITERRTLEAEIRQARETLELAMRGSDISVVVIDVPDGAPRESRQTFFDHESRRLFFNFWEPMGIDPAAAPASFEDWTRLSIHPEDYEAVLGNFRAVAESREPEWAIEHRFFRADGSVRWRLSRGTILYDGEGNVSRYLATAIDITTLKQIEGELSRAREAAEAANRAKDEFLANVSHEIRTPMNAILGMTELALDSTPSAHQRQLLSTVRSAAKNLLGIINDLLDFSKISAGKLTLDRAPFSLRAAVGDTLRALAVRAHRKGLEFSCHVSPEVPDALDGDAGRLRQVLMNLVGNAIKFTQSGQVEVDVAPSTGASLETEDVYLVFSVRDTGIGIALERQVSIFRAFEQGDSSTTRNYGGTGLGLTIAAQLVALMSGSVTVESAPGHGSKFRFSTRFARSKRPESATSLPELLADLRVLGVEDDATNRRLDLTPPSMVAPSVEPQLSFRILVAEDNEFNVALLEELLRRRGHRGEFARDGRAALELALNHVPAEIFDLMLLDLHMPGLDGFEVARVIRDHEQGTSQHLPIIALTARSSAHDRERCIAAGMDEFLSKPVEAAVLWAMMERLVRRWSPAVGVPRQAKLRVLEPRSILRACDGEASLLERILVLFRQSLPNHMSQVRTALGVGDLATLREAAHRLAGTVGAFSTVTADIALTLEDEAVRQDLESCTALVERLGSMCEALLEETATLSIDSLNL